MKKILYLLIFSFLVNSCKEAGTKEKIGADYFDDVEIYRYYYEENEYVYVAKHKSSPDIITTTWSERNGKTNTIRGAISIDSTNNVLYENDSIIVIRK